MKKLIYLFLTVLIVACSSDDGSDNNNSDPIELNPAFVGNWSGLYTSNELGEQAEFEFVINSNGEVSGFTGIFDDTIIGSVSEDGTLTAVVEGSGVEAEWVGTVNTDATASGTWSSDDGQTGSWGGTKE